MKIRLVSSLLLLTLALIPVVARAASGDLDRSYGEGGFVYAANDDASSVLALQPDDKVIAGGQCSVAGRKHFCLIRYLTNGAVDQSFGIAGKVVTEIGPGASVIQRILVLPDGKILAVGYSDVSGIPDPHYYKFAIARYHPNGSLDTTLDGDGIILNSITGGYGAKAWDVAVQPDGKFIVAGSGLDVPASFVAVRFNVDGSFDQSFAGGGILNTLIAGGASAAYAVALQPDGKIVLGGIGSTGYKTVFVRLNADGGIDNSFGGPWLLLHNTEDSAKSLRRLTVLPDGKIVAFGHFYNFSRPYLSLYRINPNGTLDTTFDGDGWVLSSILTEYYCRADDFVVQPNGKMLVAFNGAINGNVYSASARFRADGALDKQFGNNGSIVRYSTYQSGGVVVQSDGKIIFGGTFLMNPPGDHRFFLARYLNNGTRDSDFNGDRKSDVSVFRPSLGTWYLSDGGTGYSSTPFGAETDRIVPADYDGDGRIDIAVFRDGAWYVLNSSNGAFVANSFGQPGDVPVPADYDGDERSDLAVFRQGNWYIINSGDGSFRAEQFGQAGDRPVIGNFDGDLRSDLAVYRGGVWYVNGSTAGFSATQFGIGSDRPVVGDYDCDGKSDLAVYRDGDWYILGSWTGFSATHFGLGSDQPAPGEYDGDGRVDLAVFRGGTWHTMGSLVGYYYTSFGSAGDIPIPSAYVP